MGLLLKDGKYVRLNMDNCFIDNKGVHVSYYKYNSKEDRDIENSVNTLFLKLTKNYSDYSENVTTKVISDLDCDYEKLKTKEDLFDKLSENQKNLIEGLLSIENNITTLNEFLFTRDKKLLSNFTELELFKKLGYSEDITKEYSKPELCQGISGVLTNQKFTYNSMYNELKKLFKKDGFTDC